MLTRRPLNYILAENGEPKPCTDILQWAMWFESNDRQVAHDQVQAHLRLLRSPVTNIQAVLLYNALVSGIVAAVWYVVYERTGSPWTMLIFLIAVMLHQGYSENNTTKKSPNDGG